LDFILWRDFQTYAGRDTLSWGNDDILVSLIDIAGLADPQEAI
jgi:hypothetical protein